MATHTQASPTRAEPKHEQQKTSEAKQTAEKGVKSLQSFWTKFNVALLISWALFEAIYIVVPNQQISFRNSWRGAVVAAIALQIYLLVFPFYVSHFLGNDSGQVGFAVILLFFFYYFAVILLLGAEINAFFAEDIHATPDNVAVMVHHLTSHLPESKKDMQEQATPSHKDAEPKDIRPKNEVRDQETKESQTTDSSQPALPNQTDHDQHPVQKKKRKTSSQGTSNIFILAETLVGTALAFVVQYFQLRGKKKE